MSALKDSVLDLIENDPRPELNLSREILRRIAKRDLVSCSLCDIHVIDLLNGLWNVLVVCLRWNDFVQT